MNAHKTQAVIAPNGKLELSNLPFSAGVQVEVIVLESERIQQATFPLRGLPGEMIDPFEPAVDLSEWEALK